MTDSKPPKSKRPIFDHVRAARVLVDAHELGDAKAALVHGVSRRSLQNWRALLETHDALKRDYLRLLTKREDAWAVERSAALRVVLKRAIKVAEKEDDLDKLTRFIEKVGGVDVVDAELNKHASGTRSSGEGAASEDADDEAEESERTAIN